MPDVDDAIKVEKPEIAAPSASTLAARARKDARAVLTEVLRAQERYEEAVTATKARIPLLFIVALGVALVVGGLTGTVMSGQALAAPDAVVVFLGDAIIGSIVFYAAFTGVTSGEADLDEQSK